MIVRPVVEPMDRFAALFHSDAIWVVVVVPSDNFSPESGGRVKSRTAIEEMRRQGTMRLKK